MPLALRIGGALIGLVVAVSSAIRLSDELPDLFPSLFAAAPTVGQDRLAAIEKSAAEFQKLTQSGPLPRQSDPKVNVLLDTVFDTRGIAAQRPVPLSEIGSLGHWLVTMIKVGSVYLFADTGITDPAHLTHVDQKQQQQIAKNIVAFAPELGRYFDAQLELTRVMIDSLLADMAAQGGAKNPDALARVRGGLKQTLGGVLSDFEVPGVEAAWMLARMEPMMALAPATAKFLPEPDRRQVAAAAAQVAGEVDDPEVKTRLLAFAKAVAP